MKQIITPKWVLQTLTGLIAVTVLLFMTCGKAIGQVRITGAAGVTDQPKLIGQMNIGYDFKSWHIESELIRQAVKTGTWFGLKGGYIIPVSDEINLRPYLGISYRDVGNRRSLDRYVHNGVTEVISSNAEVNSWCGAIGMQYTKNNLFVDAGAFAGKQINFFITIGLTKLFN